MTDVGEDAERERISFALLVGMQTGAAPLETAWRFLKKLKIELPYDPATALLGIYPRDTGMPFRRDTRTPMFIAALSTIAKYGKSPNVCRLMNGLRCDICKQQNTTW